jgi:uncharacterized OB-fold protein
VVFDDDFFWEGAREGQLLVQECATCGTMRHPPAPMCSECQSTEVATIECRGTGRVVSWIHSKHPTIPDAPERIVAVLTLPEGVNLVANLRDIAMDDIRAGMEFEAFFEEVGGKVIPQFRPVASATP